MSNNPKLKSGEDILIASLEEKIFPAPGRLCCFDIPLFVTDGNASRHIQIVALLRQQEHASSRLSHVAFQLRAMDDIGDADAADCELGDHVASDGDIVFLREITAGNAGLIGDDDEQVSELLRAGAKLEDAGNERKIPLPKDVAKIPVDGSVAIQEESLSHGCLFQ